MEGTRRREEEEKDKQIKERPESHQFPHVPEDILHHIIIPKLPLKSLLRFQCVSKSWHSLISNPKFNLSNPRQHAIVMSNLVEAWSQERFSIHLIDDQGMLIELPVPKPLNKLPIIFYDSLVFSHSPMSTCEINLGALKLTTGQTSNGHAKSQTDNHWEANLGSDQLNYPSGLKRPIIKPLIRHGDLPRIRGSCNGFLLLSVGGELFLWNPSTRCCSNKVMSQNKLVGAHYWGYKVVSGLCYDSSTDDYKVVLMMKHPKSYIDHDVNFVMVGSLKNGTWSRVFFPYNKRRVKSGPTVNERLHWLVSENRDGDEFPRSQLIVYFDPLTNEFAKVRMPQYEQRRKEDTILGLGVLDGCLALALGRDNRWLSGSDVEVLAMKSYGDDTCWTSMFTVTNLIGLRFHNALVPLCRTKKGEVLFRWDGRGILAYDPKRDLYWDFCVPNNGCDMSIATFVESLVSPSNYNSNSISS